jgi:hypothetical protein
LTKIDFLLEFCLMRSLVRNKSYYFFIFLTLCLIKCDRRIVYSPIDRYALVNRHLPVCNKADSLSPFTVGNGEFAFTVDITGLQTLIEFYEKGIPLVTQSNWGWHTIPNVNGYNVEQTHQYFDTYGRSVPYASIMDSKPAKYLRGNPHRLHLGRIGFKQINQDYSDVKTSDITNINQVMDIWEGIIKSSFVTGGYEMKVKTCMHPELDQIAVRIESQDLNHISLGIGFDFPYGAPEWGKTTYNRNSPDQHKSIIIDRGVDFVIIERQLDETVYYVEIRWQGSAQFKEIKNHSYILIINEEKKFEFTCNFSTKKEMKRKDVFSTFKRTKNHWRRFWHSGGAVDLSGSSHTQAMELERRIVLSQYLTAIQCCGSLPPQETGLTVNSWFGKFHLEMHWWHAVHFVLWGRPELLEKSLSWYELIMPHAKEKVELQGYDGVRWPKMTSPEGYDSPSSIGVFLIWQQPHPIYFAELLYRSKKNKKILNRYKDIVFATADFMASYAHWDEENNRYVLGPPLIPAQEIYKPTETMNPAFELSYWAYGLATAQKWRERLGLPRDEKWDHVVKYLSPLLINNGFYQNTETVLNTFKDESHRRDHPTVLGAFGMLPNNEIDVDIMRRTLEQVLVSWNWKHTWGWDYPMVAMTAARVGRSDLAIEALLKNEQKNTYLNNGHNYQTDDLPLYLPGNGGLLTAIAMMCAGWDGAPDVNAPGFPKDGKWVVKFEGLKMLP